MLTCQRLYCFCGLRFVRMLCVRTRRSLRLALCTVDKLKPNCIATWSFNYDKGAMGEDSLIKELSGWSVLFMGIMQTNSWSLAAS